MLGGKLKEARREAGLSLDAMARVTGHPASSIARWERGDYQPRFDTMCGLARVLGKPLDFFCSCEDES